MVLTKIDLDEAVGLLTQRFIGIIDERITGVASRISSLEETAIKNQQEIELQANKITVLESTNMELRSSIDDLSSKLENLVSGELQSHQPSDFKQQLNEVEERLEERTNRQLRQTIIIKGIKELDNETWEDTKDLVSNQIAKNLGISTRVADDMLNRVHRGKHSENPLDHNKPRPIYALLHKWHDCEEILEVFRTLNINRKSSVRAEYMFGPKTTIRRNMALFERKQLKESGKIISGYISYPARLLGKYPGSNKYVLVKDFSNHEVKLKFKANSIPTA